jgi:hypothetical protein
MDKTTTPVFRPTLLATFASKSNPLHVHEVRLGKDGNIYCTCPSWRFQKNHPMNRSCKHLEAFRQQTVLSGKVLAVQGTSPPPVAIRAPRKSRKQPRVWWDKLGAY